MNIVGVRLAGSGVRQPDAGWGFQRARSRHLGVQSSLLRDEDDDPLLDALRRGAGPHGRAVRPSRGLPAGRLLPALPVAARHRADPFLLDLVRRHPGDVRRVRPDHLPVPALAAQDADPRRRRLPLRGRADRDGLRGGVRLPRKDGEEGGGRGKGRPAADAVPGVDLPRRVEAQDPPEDRSGRAEEEGGIREGDQDSPRRVRRDREGTCEGADLSDRPWDSSWAASGWPAAGC